MADRQLVGSRTRQVIDYLRYNRHQLIVDGAILLTWLIVSAAVFRWLALPQWLHFLVMFGGVAVYTKLTPSWEWPSRGPD